jgi:hypothetical protein
MERLYRSLWRIANLEKSGKIVNTPSQNIRSTGNEKMGWNKGNGLKRMNAGMEDSVLIICILTRTTYDPWEEPQLQYDTYKLPIIVPVKSCCDVCNCTCNCLGKYRVTFVRFLGSQRIGSWIEFGWTCCSVEYRVDIRHLKGRPRQGIQS